LSSGLPSGEEASPEPERRRPATGRLAGDVVVPGEDLDHGLAGGHTRHGAHTEELFEVCLDRNSGEVLYRIRAVSWPQSVLAWVGQPIVRLLQARFRRDSAASMIGAASGSAPDYLR
jgi:hypothetical protein